FAAQVLFDLGKPARKAVPRLRPLLYDADNATRDQAAVTLAKLDPDNPEVLKTLLAMLDENDEDVRDKAHSGLSRLGPRALPALDKLVLRCHARATGKLTPEQFLELHAIADIGPVGLPRLGKLLFPDLTESGRIVLLLMTTSPELVNCLLNLL